MKKVLKSLFAQNYFAILSFGFKLNATPRSYEIAKSYQQFRNKTIFMSD